MADTLIAALATLDLASMNRYLASELRPERERAIVYGDAATLPALLSGAPGAWPVEVAPSR